MATQTKKITFDTVALLFGRALGLLLSLIRLSFLARFLGVAKFGILNFATYFTSLFQSFFDLGLSQILTREIAQDPSHSREILGQALLLKSIATFASSFLIIAGLEISGADSETTIAVILTTVALGISNISMAFSGAFQAHRKVFLVSTFAIVNDAILSAAIIALLPHRPMIETVLILTTLVAALNLGAQVIAYRKLVGWPTMRWRLSLTQTLMKQGIPIALGGLGVSCYMFIGPTILKYSRGEFEVGIYGAAYKLISIATLLPTAFTQVVFPVLSNFAANAPNKLDKALRDSLHVMSEISIPLAVGTIVLAPQIIGFLYPQDFLPASSVLQLIIAGNAFGYLSWVLNSFLLSVNHQRFFMVNSLVTALAVSAACLLLVPRFGYLSSAAITCGADVFLFVSLAIFTRKIGYGLPRLKSFIMIFLAAGIMGVIVYLLRTWPLFVVVPIGITAYFFLLHRLRILGDQEREIITRVLNRLRGTDPS